MQYWRGFYHFIDFLSLLLFHTILFTVLFTDFSKDRIFTYALTTRGRRIQLAARNQ